MSGRKSGEGSESRRGDDNCGPGRPEQIPKGGGGMSTPDPRSPIALQPRPHEAAMATAAKNTRRTPHYSQPQVSRRAGGKRFLWAAPSRLVRCALGSRLSECCSVETLLS